jgi:lysozyme family protein
MAKTPDRNADFQNGWEAAVEAVRAWHEAKAKQAMVQSTRTRFPKNLEREAEVHRRCAEQIVLLSPDDV